MASTNMANMQVPFFDLKEQTRRLQGELDAAIGAVVSAGSFILGPAVERFEEAFARYVGTRYCVGLNNGTSALHMALLAADVGPGDEVITTPHTWISTSWAISYVGAKPVFVDIDPVTFNLDPARVAGAVTSRTKAILPVHLYGQACDLDALSALAQRHNLALIEDCAQAHGAYWKGRRVGSVGDVGAFSFYPSKNLGAFGEAGAIATNDEELARRIRRLRDHAQADRHVHTEIGYNTRMEGLQGAVLDVKLKHLDGWNAARRRIAHGFHERLANVPGLRLPALPADDSRHVWHLFVALLESHDRNAIRLLLADRGVAAGVHYPTLVPFQPAYAHWNHKPGDFPVAEQVARQCLSLPMFAELTDEQLDYTAESLRAVLA